MSNFSQNAQATICLCFFCEMKSYFREISKICVLSLDWRTLLMAISSGKQAKGERLPTNGFYELKSFFKCLRNLIIHLVDATCRVK